MSSTNSHAGERLTAGAAGLFSVCRGAVRQVCFWAAIVAPFLWVSLLFRGTVTASEYVTLTGLVAINLIALVGGHGYRPDLDRRDAGERERAES